MNDAVYRAVTVFLSGNIVAIIVVCAGVLFALGWWARGVNDGIKKIPSLTEKIDKLSEKVHKVYGFLVHRFGEPLFVSSSPTMLSDYGRELSQRIQASDLAGRYAERLQQRTANQDVDRHAPRKNP